MAKSFAEKMQQVAQNSRDMNKKYPPTTINTAPKKKVEPKVYTSSDKPNTPEAIADYESRPGKPKNPGPPPWQETGRETVDRVLRKRGDVNLPLSTASPEVKKRLGMK
jgi:hypothetical protein